jgi:hypothetical protein
MAMRMAPYSGQRSSLERCQGRQAMGGISYSSTQVTKKTSVVFIFLQMGAGHVRVMRGPFASGLSLVKVGRENSYFLILSLLKTQ